MAEYNTAGELNIELEETPSTECLCAGTQAGVGGGDWNGGLCAADAGRD